MILCHGTCRAWIYVYFFLFLGANFMMARCRWCSFYIWKVSYNLSPHTLGICNKMSNVGTLPAFIAFLIIHPDFLIVCICARKTRNTIIYLWSLLGKGWWEKPWFSTRRIMSKNGVPTNWNASRLIITLRGKMMRRGSTRVTVCDTI